jgi:hypothetical protein
MKTARWSVLTPAAILRVNKTSKMLTFPAASNSFCDGSRYQPVAQQSQTLGASDGATSWATGRQLGLSDAARSDGNERKRLFVWTQDCNETVNVYFGSDP